MSATITPTEQDMYKVLGDFLTSILPAGTPIEQGQINRVPPPDADDYVYMTSNGFKRLSTNVDASADALFTGSISGTTLTIEAVEYGAINVGSPVFGVGVAASTFVTALGSGTGGTGTYTVNNAQTVASEPIAAGMQSILAPREITVQLDIHGSHGQDNSIVIEGVFRDGYAWDFFNAAQSGAIAPLYVSDARQLPFLNDSQQIEQRWTMDVALQINPTIALPQQYMEAVSVDIVEVDARFPPT